MAKKKFKSTVPDAINVELKTCYYYMGCWYHKHNLDDCKMSKKNWTAAESSMKNKEFLEKISKLFNETQEITNYEVQWECDWKKEKSQNEKVKKFLEKYYVRRPRRRLIPHEASNIFIKSLINISS